MIRQFMLFSRRLLGIMAVLALTATLAQAQMPEQGQYKEPLFRVSKANVDSRPQAPAHPLDPALQLAKDGLKRFQTVRDYKAVVVKRERINGTLGEYEFMYAKIRNERPDHRQKFAVYMYFLKPAAVQGRECLYVSGSNNGKLIAHEGKNSVLGRFGSVWLRPEGPIAMKGQLYPITEIGIENLMVKLVERGERDRQRDECQVQFHKGANINGRQCTMLEVIHPVPRPHFDFHKAQIFIDDELQIPIRYAAFGWPQNGQDPPVLEEYTYLKLELNPGLTEQDFDHENPDYNF